MTRKEAIKRLHDINPNQPQQENLINQIFDDLEGTKEETKLGPWAWVKTEYCALFKQKNPDRGGKVRESISRMKKMFAADPTIRKEDVIGTVQLYLSQTDSRYIRYPHYFLKKGQGTSAIYEFADWYDKYKEALTKEDNSVNRSSKTNTMQ